MRRRLPWRGRGGRGERRAARRRLAAAARVISRVPFSVSRSSVPSGAAYRVSGGVRSPGPRRAPSRGGSNSARTAGGHSPHAAAAPQPRYRHRLARPTTPHGIPSTDTLFASIESTPIDKVKVVYRLDQITEGRRCEAKS